MLPRPQQAPACFGLGRTAMDWMPSFSADESTCIATQGDVILAYRSNPLPWAKMLNAYGVEIQSVANSLTLRVPAVADTF